MKRNSRIYVAGHTGMVGSAITRALIREGYENLILRTHKRLDLLSQKKTRNFFQKECPDYVFMAAAKVGGIFANNTYRAEFLYENLMIQNNIIHSAFESGVKKMIFLGSACIYPKEVIQPIMEDRLLQGGFEPTNEPYAIAKIAGIKMCENYFKQYGCDFISILPCNLYGQNDNYNLENSHVLPAIIRKMRLAKLLGENNWDQITKEISKKGTYEISVTKDQQSIIDFLNRNGIKKGHQGVALSLWGSGKPWREFMHVDDLAGASLFVMNNISSRQLYEKHGFTYLNAGSATELQIMELAQIIKELIGFNGKIIWNMSMPEGMDRKLLDSGVLNSYGWQPRINLRKGLEITLTDYMKRFVK